MNTCHVHNDIYIKYKFNYSFDYILKNTKKVYSYSFLISYRIDYKNKKTMKSSCGKEFKKKI